MSDEWRKSTHSGAQNCPEVREWRKARRSVNNGACIEAGQCSHGIAIRDSMDPDGPILAFGGGEWQRFLLRLKLAH